jgi:predicted lipid-binding transport protein (Tim44 family)
VDASGGEQPGAPLRLRIVKGPQEGEELALTGPAVIGRSSTNAALVIRDSEASRRHASVIPEGDSLNVEDLGSTNGTFVNEERIDGRRSMVAGDQLRIGRTVFELALTEPGAGAEVEPAAADDEAAAAESEAAVEEPEAAQAEAEVVEPVPEAAVEEPEAAEPVEPVPEAEVVEPEAAEPEAAEPVAPAEAEEPAPAPPADWASEAAEAKETAKLLHRRLDESFSAVLRAWSNRDVEKLRPFVSQGHLARANEAADALDREYQVNYIKDLNLRDVAVRRPAAGAGEAEPAEVYVSFVARDWIEDLRTGEAIEGDNERPHAMIERWTFVHEGRRGWVIDRVESVWSAPAEDGGADDWPGLPAGWYSLRNRPASWREWTGSAWEAAPAPTS